MTFSFTPTASGTELRLRLNGQDVPYERWPIDAPRDVLAAVERVTALVQDGQAVEDDALVLLSHEAVASLSPRIAAQLGLPALADVIARVETTGLVTGASFAATLRWLRPNGQAILGVTRMGVWLSFGGRTHRLSAALLAIADAVQNVAEAAELALRLAAIARLREALPAADRSVVAHGLPTQIDIVQADAFSLDLQGSGTAARLVPILHRAGQTEMLLPPEQQGAFGQKQFNDFPDVRQVYTLPGNVFLVLTPALRRVLSVVRRHQTSAIGVKRALLAAPRAYLSADLEGDDDPTLLDQVETLFIETPAYSDRVIGLGLWEPRDVPWVTGIPIDWLGRGEANGGSSVGSSGGSSGGLGGDGKKAPRPQLNGLDRTDAAQLAKAMRTALADGAPTIQHKPAEGPPIDIPVSQALLTALEERAAAPEAAEPAPPALVPLIHTNEGRLDHQQDFVRRQPLLAKAIPACLGTRLKLHQADGLDWLQESWRAGAPGVLLADDMGLGKTLQGLAFLAWVREAMTRGDMPRAPILIVAPTGLLGNWAEEHDRHLKHDGLGVCLPAFGRGLRALRRPGTPELDIARLQAADWVLTTYETLRDQSKDFAAVRFAVLLADEAQKVKTPAARMTDALKSMNADFRLAMTGTPVENRLADLWCIVDGVRSGWLGALAEFSRTYEADPDETKIASLKARLDQPFGGTPPLMKRRMKEDHLPDLPKAEIHLHTAPMPPLQRAAYQAALTEARSTDGEAGILQAIHRFRAVSLHPDPEMEGDDDAFIAASARLATSFARLDEIAAAGERALIFLDNRALQPRLAGVIQRRYRMAAQPEIINGAVSGPRRQERVNRFQTAPAGFDVLLLSPRAAGVGLTITRANHVFHIERWWNPAVEDQCTARALRIGQTRTVHVHVPMAVLDGGERAFDQNLHDLLERKRGLMRQTMLPPELNSRDGEELLAFTLNGAPTPP